jgi:nitrile hydratase beta subunit
MGDAHDLGGARGYGPVEAEPERDEPVFHEEWEKTVAGLMLVLGRDQRWSVDRFRRMIESQPPLTYLGHSYYENWMASLERLLVDRGLVTEEELSAGVPSGEPGGGPAGADGRWVPSFTVTGPPPRFSTGDRVRSLARNPDAHTRQPGYVRGRVGTVLRHVGAEPLPELAAELVCAPEHLYLVRFEAEDLWGRDGGPRDAVLIELWESQLEPLVPAP